MQITTTSLPVTPWDKRLLNAKRLEHERIQKARKARIDRDKLYRLVAAQKRSGYDLSAW